MSTLKEKRAAKHARQMASSQVQPIADATAQPIVRSTQPSLSGELERLAALHDEGSLSADEFQAAKSRLLE